MIGSMSIVNVFMSFLYACNMLMSWHCNVLMRSYYNMVNYNNMNYKNYDVIIF